MVVFIMSSQVHTEDARPQGDWKTMTHELRATLTQAWTPLPYIPYQGDLRTERFEVCTAGLELQRGHFASARNELLRLITAPTDHIPNERYKVALEAFSRFTDSEDPVDKLGSPPDWIYHW